MKTFKLNTQTKIKSGFETPENYFEDFSARVMQQLPLNEPKTISIYQSRKTWLYIAAAILIFALSIPIFTNYYKQKSEIDSEILENYISYQSNVSNAELANLLDEEDIQNIKIDMEIDTKSIENELVTNKNLELYILN